MKHLPLEELQTLKTELHRLGKDEAHRHLLSCRHCQKRSFTPFPFDPGETLAPPTDTPEGRILGRTLASLHHGLASSELLRKGSDRLYDQLMALPDAQRFAAAVNEHRFAIPSLPHRLLEEAEALLATQPQDSAKRAALASLLARRMPLTWSGLERDSLLGRAFAIEGEASRLQGDLLKAEAALQGAIQHLEQIPPTSFERADSCRKLARLRQEQGRSDEALALIARAAYLFEGLLEPEAVAACRDDQGWMLLGEVEPVEALLAFEEAAAWWASPTMSFEAWLSARHGLALCLADLGDQARTERLVAELLMEGAERPPLDRLRVAVVEADIARALDESDRAIAKLAEALPRFFEEGAVFDGVLAAFDLARLYIEEAQPERIAHLQSELEGAEGLSALLREVVAFALSFLIRHGMEGLDVLDAAKAFNGRVRHNPSLRFSVLRAPLHELPWSATTLEFRRELAAMAGMAEGVSRLSDAEIPAADRDRLGWTAEAARGVSLLFSTLVETHQEEQVH